MAYFRGVGTLVNVPLSYLLRLTLMIKGISANFVVSSSLGVLFAYVADCFVRVGINVEFDGIGALRASPAFPSFVPPLGRRAFSIVNVDGVGMFLNVNNYDTVPVIRLPNFRSRVRPPPSASVFRQLSPINNVRFAEFVRIGSRQQVGRSSDLQDGLGNAPYDNGAVLFADFGSVKP